MQMPGYRLDEYQVVISPNEDLRSRITAIKKEFNDKYQVTVPTGNRPHIALARFVTWSMMEEKVRAKLRHIAMGLAPFKIELKDFGSYPSHTIFVNVATKSPVQNLIKELKTAQRLMKVHPDHDPHFLADPHITIARKLKPWQYEKGWLEYSNHHFHARIAADSMLLLKRSLGDKAYQIVERFEFLNMPVTTRQGELFFQA